MLPLGSAAIPGGCRAGEGKSAVKATPGPGPPRGPQTSVLTFQSFSWKSVPAPRASEAPARPASPVSLLSLASFGGRKWHCRVWRQLARAPTLRTPWQSPLLGAPLPPPQWRLPLAPRDEALVLPLWPGRAAWSRGGGREGRRAWFVQVLTPPLPSSSSSSHPRLAAPAQLRVAPCPSLASGQDPHFAKGSGSGDPEAVLTSSVRGPAPRSGGGGATPSPSSAPGHPCGGPRLPPPCATRPGGPGGVGRRIPGGAQC